MIFEVSPSQIENLDSKQLVEILRRLLHAEAHKAGISLRGVSVPLQITVSDGGEDARIWWEGGNDETDYLTSRFSIFQSKATDPGPAGWKKEVWTKSSQKKGATPKLNDAVRKALSEHGSYIGFTSTPLVGNKFDERIKAIKDGITEAGADPDDLAAIDIYDANKIAAWASHYPPVAVWLNEMQSGLSLGGFLTVEGWGKKAEFASIEHVPDNAARYLLSVDDDRPSSKQRSDARNALTFLQAKERLSDHFAEPRTSARIAGPSGVGKTRFAFEIFKDASTVAKFVNTTAAVYCDYRSVGQQLLPLIESLVRLGSSAILIIDECPRDVAVHLAEIVTTTDSQLRLVTIDIDDRTIPLERCLNISVAPSDTGLVEGIIRQRLKGGSNTEVDYIKDLCGGFPRIAVLATDNFTDNGPILRSIDDVVARILRGAGINEQDQVRSIECLALFDGLGADGDYSKPFNFVAERLAGLSGDRMFEHIAQASRHHLVDRRGHFFAAQPLPIAAYLGARRLDLLRVSTIVSFIQLLPDEPREAFLKQWRHFDGSQTARAAAERMLQSDGIFGTLEALNTEHGSKCFDSLVHVAPEACANAASRLFAGLSINELKEIKDGRLYLSSALQKLVFRQKSFISAARILMRLSAASNDTWDDSSASAFTNLYQLYLSGTEAGPSERFGILDEGISSKDPQLLQICVDALASTLNRYHFSRAGGTERIGMQTPLRDWQPKTWDDVFEFHRGGLRRLLKLRQEDESLRERCDGIIASHLRGLISPSLLDDIEAVIDEVVRERGFWLDAIKAIGDWLYFDREAAPKDFGDRVRALYDRLLPGDLIGKALLYTKFWTADIRDPDLVYNREHDTSRDYEYSTRKAVEIAAEIAKDSSVADRAIQAMSVEELHNADPFSQELALRIEDPITAFRVAVQACEDAATSKGIRFICGMLRGIDQRDGKIATECIQTALNSEVLKSRAISIYTSVNITVERLHEIIESLRAGTLRASEFAALSYGRGLDALGAGEIEPLLNELTSGYGAEGIWTALEIVAMYQHSRKTVDPLILSFIKEQVVSPELLRQVRNANMDGHNFESLVALVHRNGGMDDHFVTNLCDQLTRLCQVENRAVFSALDDEAGKILKLLVSEEPSLSWQIISRFFEIATPSERRQLENLIKPSRYDFEGKSHDEAGLLFGIPEEDLTSWARLDPANRIAFLCKFYPMLANDEADLPTWHPAMERLAGEFGGIAEFRRGIARRMYPSSWSGSIVPYLEVYLDPLEKWFTHKIPDLALWAREMHGAVETQITNERETEEGV